MQSFKLITRIVVRIIALLVLSDMHVVQMIIDNNDMKKLVFLEWGHRLVTLGAPAETNLLVKFGIALKT